MLDSMLMVKHGVTRFTQKAVVNCLIRSGILSKNKMKECLYVVGQE